jgi:putative transposase
MPRPLRIHVPDGFYHVTLRGNHRQAIFTRDCERTLLNTIVARAIEKYDARLHAYCWMTNHLHLIVQVRASPLGKVIQQIASQYARAFQLNLKTTGHLFENRYHATLIDTDAYLLEALRYVHQNPVRAGLVPAVAHYRWSSHTAYLRGAGDLLVTTDFALSLLSRDRARAVIRYGAFIDDVPPAEMAARLKALDEGAPLLGNSEFIARHTPSPQLPSALETMIENACSHFGVTRVDLRSPRRKSHLVAARTWIAHSAINSGAATLAEVARALNRDEASLRSAIRNRIGSDGDLVDDPA